MRPWSEPFAEERFTGDLLRNRMLNELFHEAVPVILHEDDLNAMYFSIENRSPFLDRELFEFCSRIPTRHLIRDGRAKAVLRDAMRGIVPDRSSTTAERSASTRRSTRSSTSRSPRCARPCSSDSPVFDLVRRDRIEALIAKPDLPNSESKFLFYFLSAKMFLEEFAA